LKYLIAGLGNIGEEYKNTRHNVGFMVLDAAAAASNISFMDRRYGFISEMRYKNASAILLKPSTLMNRSGNAVRYWMQKEKIPPENLLVITDDIAIPIGSMRLRARGGDGGHNGLASISEILGTNDYARLRIGIGNNFGRGGQIDYVLGEWTEEELAVINKRLSLSIEIIRSFVTAGCELTMTAFNKAGKFSADGDTKGGKDR
jgi:PTH1 family peptidyl-tRNA hydrolase